MGQRLDFLSRSVIGSVTRSQRNDLAELTQLLCVQRRNPRELRRDDDGEAVEIISPRQFQEMIGRRQDLVGDLDDDDDDDDDDAGYIGVTDIIGAMERAAMGAKLTRQERKAIRHAKKAMKKAARRGNDNEAAEMALALRQAGKPIVLTDQENILRKLNMPLSTVSVAANSTGSFAVVVQETMRLERLFLYPVGGNYDNLWVGDIFCGRQTNSVVPGNEEPMINYSPTAVDSGIEGFTVNYGLTLRIGLRNGTANPVVVGGKIKGRTLTG